jgi:hypothetical protein
MQPTYLPWAGYFNLINSVDLFVFLDDVQYQKNSWHNRNRILSKNDVQWITVPVKHRTLSQKISETEICNEKNWRRKHANSIIHSYSHHEHFNSVKDIVELIKKVEAENLAQLNISIIEYIARKLGIKTEFICSSVIFKEGVRTERIVSILNYLGVKEYISPVGSVEYLEEDRFANQTTVSLKFQNFKSDEYVQKGGKEFKPNLSILDVLANIGLENTFKYLKK